MSVIQAAQVIYGNVEADRSPQHRGGFQVLFRSFSRLSEDQVTREIGPRLFFASTNPHQEKHCFFAMPSGGVVVARCVPVVGTDQFSRKGLYLAHALVFSREDFLRLANNPFRILDHFQFFSSFEEASIASTGEGGDIPLAQIPFSSSYGHDASGAVSREHVLNLLILAYRFALSQSGEGAIGFYGEASKMLSILRFLFILLPIRLRTKCTFDTFFVAGSPGRMPYWAVGFPESQNRDPNFLPFEIERNSFGASIELQSKNAFESWLRWMLAPPLSDLSKHIDEAFYVSEFLDGRRLAGSTLEQANPALLIGFQPFLENRLREGLRTQIGETLCERLFPQAIAWLGQQGLAALAPIAEGFSVKQMELWLCDAYISSYDKPATTELRQLERFLSRNQQSMLWMIYLRWTDQWPALRSVLRSAEPAVARHFAKWALATVQAALRSTAEPGMLLSLGLYTEGDHLQETVNVLSAILDKSPDEILSVSSSKGGVPGSVPINQIIDLFAMFLERT